jgi:hypothetical protein
MYRFRVDLYSGEARFVFYWVVYIPHLRQECHNSKFGIFELLVQKETFADVI